MIEPEKLPPTDEAAKYHGFHAQLQVVEWKMLDQRFNLWPTEWGWKEIITSQNKKYLTPVMPLPKNKLTGLYLLIIISIMLYLYRIVNKRPLMTMQMMLKMTMEEVLTLTNKTRTPTITLMLVMSESFLKGYLNPDILIKYE